MEQALLDSVWQGLLFPFPFPIFVDMKENSFLKRVFSSKVLPSWTILLFDLVVIVFAVFCGYLTRYLFGGTALSDGEMGLTLLIVVVFALIFFRVFLFNPVILSLSIIP